MKIRLLINYLLCEYAVITAGNYKMHIYTMSMM